MISRRGSWSDKLFIACTMRLSGGEGACWFKLCATSSAFPPFCALPREGGDSSYRTVDSIWEDSSTTSVQWLQQKQTRLYSVADNLGAWCVVNRVCNRSSVGLGPVRGSTGRTGGRGENSCCRWGVEEHDGGPREGCVWQPCPLRRVEFRMSEPE